MAQNEKSLDLPIGASCDGVALAPGGSVPARADGSIIPTRGVKFTSTGTAVVIMRSGTTLTFPVLSGEILAICINGLDATSGVSAVAFY